MAKEEDDDARDELEWVTICEFYDFSGNNFFHFVEGNPKPLLHVKQLPYKYVRNPYSLLVFNKHLRNSGGLSDVKLIAALLERMNELDTIELRHAHKSYPKDLLNTGAVTDPESLIKSLRDAGPDDMVLVDVQNGVRLTDVITQTGMSGPMPAIAKSREQLASTIDFVSGMPQYSRGKTGTSDVATELALVDSASRTRNGNRVTIMGDLVEDVAKKIGGLWQEFLDEGREIPIKLDDDSDEIMMLDRESLGFDYPLIEEATGGENAWEETWYYDLNVVPFSPTENHKMLKVQKLQTFYPLLAQSPYVDKAKLDRNLLEALGMEDVYNPKGAEQAQQQMQQMQAQQQGTPEGQQATGATSDVISTGAMPPGTPTTDEMSGVDHRMLADQPKVG
jgi:hypothetical protein